MTVLIVVTVLILALVGAVLFLASRRPDTFRIERRTVIRAPAEAIYPWIEDFQRWREWSPYEGIDPDMQRTYSGPPSGVGAAYAWSGNNKAGAGSMEITEATAPSRVRLKLDFTRPFEGHNVADFIIAPHAEGTELTWAMHGPSPLISKIMGLFIDIDRMVGKDFEVGLTRLKAAAEG